MASSPQTFSPRELAAALGVSESSMKRWIDAGELRAARTSGGHRRVTKQEAVRFIRRQRLPVVNPVVLGLGEIVPALAAAESRALTADVFVEAFTSEGAQAGPLLVAAYLQGASLPALFDGPLREALHRVGTFWRGGEEGIVFEHRAVDELLGALNQIRSLLPPPGSGAPVAVGAAASGDPYLLPSLVAATVLADLGLHVTNLGADTPGTVLAEAARRADADFVWLSVSIEVDPPAFEKALADLAAALAPTPLVVGGRGVEAVKPAPVPGMHILPSMEDLAAFVTARWPGRGSGVSE